eukprot:6111022-Ditylum_brightwellii.AAC.1
MTTKKTALEHVLTTLGYEDDEKAIGKETIRSLHRMKTITKESLKDSDAIEDVFTKEHRNKFLMVRVKESAKEEATIEVKLEEEVATNVVLSAATKGSGNDGIS